MKEKLKRKFRIVEKLLIKRKNKKAEKFIELIIEKNQYINKI